MERTRGRIRTNVRAYVRPLCTPRSRLRPVRAITHDVRTYADARVRGVRPTGEKVHLLERPFTSRQSWRGRSDGPLFFSIDKLHEVERYSRCDTKLASWPDKGVRQ